MKDEAMQLHEAQRSEARERIAEVEGELKDFMETKLVQIADELNHETQARRLAVEREQESNHRCARLEEECRSATREAQTLQRQLAETVQKSNQIHEEERPSLKQQLDLKQHVILSAREELRESRKIEKLQESLRQSLVATENVEDQLIQLQSARSTIEQMDQEIGRRNEEINRLNRV